VSKKKKLTDRQKAIFGWAHQSQSRGRINAMIEFGKPDLAVATDDLDADPWAFNVLNGTLDLRKGTLRPHCREDLLTKIAEVEFDSKATCPIWDAFLNRIFDDNQDIIAFLRRWIGYSLTGDTSEHVLVLFYGTGANGKTTLIETIAALLGPYAKKAEIAAFLDKQNDQIRNDLASLAGARMVSAVEVPEGRKLAEALVKEVTGGDTITARFLFKEFFEFRPQFKLIISGNHLPEIRGNDEGIWRRVLVVPFDVTIPPEERDKNLLDKLKAELPGILNWTLAGLREWQEGGLQAPEAVRLVTQQYRDEMDIIGAFLADECVIDPKEFVSVANLYEAYEHWCHQNGDDPIKKRTFGRRMGDRGFHAEAEWIPEWKGTHRAYRGIGLKALGARPQRDPGQGHLGGGF
jgi:putative DNA primase/helicase